jgi:membrane associated rhomboid family serine protease
MITGRCLCGATIELPASLVGEISGCDQCGDAHLVTGGPSEDADRPITARLRILNSPAGPGGQILLTGPVPIEVGKSDTAHLCLQGNRVSRRHCLLSPTADGGWEVRDNNSTNGTLVNGVKVASHTLQANDKLTLGDYELEYFPAGVVALSASSAASAEDGQGDFLANLDSVTASLETAPRAAAVAVAAPKPVKPAKTGGGPTCPSCGKSLPKNAKICVDCGINITTGRSLVTAKGFDENFFAARCETFIPLVSLFVPLGLYPVASEAFGTKKPYYIWGTAIITVLISILFFVMVRTDEGYDNYKNLMLWTGQAPQKVDSTNIEEQVNKTLEEELKDVPAKDRPKGKELEDLKKEIRTDLRDDQRRSSELGEQRWYQFFTAAYLHDFSSIFGFIMHLGGNMLFLFVLGTGVNSILGNIKTAIIYPLLAVSSHIFAAVATSGDDLHANLGASGAIMGLAGMYLVLFPVHKVHMAFWLRLWLGFRTKCFWKVWALRGFWVVLFFISFDVVATIMRSRDGVGHWAHLGGFISGVVVGLALLLSRQVNAGGGDILSAILGKRAWALLGKPSDRAPAMA